MHLTGRVAQGSLSVSYIGRPSLMLCLAAQQNGAHFYSARELSSKRGAKDSYTTTQLLQ